MQQSPEQVVYRAIFNQMTVLEPAAFELWIGGRLAIGITQSELARWCGMSIQSVRKSIVTLERTGWIRCIRIRGYEHLYQLEPWNAHQAFQANDYQTPLKP